VRFAWDAGNNALNRRKHGIGFEECKELFTSGVEYLELFDEAHSKDEERFLAIGPIARGLVAVVWTERHKNVVRVVSARLATKREHTDVDDFRRLASGAPHVVIANIA